MLGRRKPQSAPTEELDTVAAIWILACNDERPEISYAGLRHRLHLDTRVDERRLVASRGELFRLGIPKARLEDLKAEYRIGKRMPSWLRSLPEDQRAGAIDGLSSDDYFRSQFRAQPDAKPSELEILDWGLKHIDRLRTSAADKRDAGLKRWTTVGVPLLSTAVAVSAIASSTYMQRHASSDQRVLKEYEVSFRPRFDGYVRLMQGTNAVFEQALRDSDQINDAINELEGAQVQLDPLLTPSARAKMHDEILEFEFDCVRLRRRTNTPEYSHAEEVAKFIDWRRRLGELIYGSLFSA